MSPVQDPASQAAGSDDAVRVVVVDDQPDAADMLAAALALEGCQARTAQSGEEALPLIDQFQPHAVLLDVSMPGDGADRRQRQRPGRRAREPDV